MGRNHIGPFYVFTNIKRPNVVSTHYLLCIKHIGGFRANHVSSIVRFIVVQGAPRGLPEAPRRLPGSLFGCFLGRFSIQKHPKRLSRSFLGASGRSLGAPWTTMNRTMLETWLDHKKHPKHTHTHTRKIAFLRCGKLTNK